MYKLLIVDDEPTVRFGLKAYFDWNAFGIEVAGEADDGDVALEQLEILKPDLMLTDVRMPNLDGIQLAEEARLRYPHMKIVFVSGHDDAEYLKSALKAKAVDYIFKPVNLQELAAVIERVVTALRTEQQERTRIADMQVKLTQSMPLLQEKFLMSLIRDGIPALARTSERMQFLGLDLPLDADYWVIVIRLDNSTDVVESRSERDLQLLSYSVLNVVQELIDCHIAGYVFEHRMGEFIGILRTGDEDAEAILFQLAEEVRDSLLTFLKMSVTIGVGERIVGLAALPQAYAQAREAADQRWYLGKNRIISIDNLEQRENGLYRFAAAQEERLVSALKAADADKLMDELRDIYESLSRNRKEGFPYVRNLSLQLLLLAGRTLLEVKIQPEDAGQESLAQVLQLETIEEIRRMIEARYMEACELIRMKRSGKPKNVIERIQSIMESRFAENLQVGDIAKEVFLSTTYLCLLFKQETGETINEYLTRVRVDKAKEMLKDSANKFYEVGYAVGYSDPSYFSKIFKKYTGFTPSAYRDHVM